MYVPLSGIATHAKLALKIKASPASMEVVSGRHTATPKTGVSTVGSLNNYTPGFERALPVATLEPGDIGEYVEPEVATVPFDRPKVKFTFDGGDWSEPVARNEWAERGPMIEQSLPDLDRKYKNAVYKRFIDGYDKRPDARPGPIDDEMKIVLPMLDEDLARAIDDRDLFELNKLKMIGRKLPMNLKTSDWARRCAKALDNVLTKSTEAKRGKISKVNDKKAKVSRVAGMKGPVSEFNLFSPLQYAVDKSGPPLRSESVDIDRVDVAPDRLPLKSKPLEDKNERINKLSLLVRRLDAVHVGYGALETKAFAPVAFERFHMPIRLEALTSEYKSWTDKIVSWVCKDFSRTCCHSIELPKGFVLYTMANFWALNGCKNDRASLLACKTFVKANLRQILLTPLQEFNCMVYIPALSYWLSRPSLENSDLLFVDGFTHDRKRSNLVRWVAWALTFGLVDNKPKRNDDVLKLMGIDNTTTHNALQIDVVAERPAAVDVAMRAGASIKQVGQESDKDNEGVRQAFCVAFSVPDYKPVVYSKSAYAERAAVTKRILAKPKNQADVDEVGRFRKWCRMNFEELFGATGFKVKPLPFDEWLKNCNCAPSQRALYRRAHDKLKNDGVDFDNVRLSKDQLEQYSRNKAFVKREFLLFRTRNGVKAKAPRLIQGCEAEYMVLTGPWYAAFNGFLRDRWDLNNVITYSSGRSMVEVANCFVAGSDGMLIGDTDQSSFDACFIKEVLDIETEIAQRCGAPRHVVALHNAMADKHGGTPLGLSYKCPGTRASGEGCTSSFNSLMNGLMHTYIAAGGASKSTTVKSVAEMRGQCKFIVCGDDNGFWHSGTRIDWSACFAKLGFECVSNYRSELCRMEFCSSRLTRVMGGYAFIPKVGRILSKIGYSLSANNPVEAKQFIYGTCLSLDNAVGGHPILGLVLQKLRAALGKRAPKFDRDEPWKMKSPQRLCYTNESFLDLMRQYDWSEAKMAEFARNLRTYCIMDEVTCPLYLQLCDIDSDGDNDVVLDECEFGDAPIEFAKTKPTLLESYQRMSVRLQTFVESLEAKMRSNKVRHPNDFLNAGVVATNLADYGIRPSGCGPRPPPPIDLTRFGIEPNPGPMTVEERTAVEALGVVFKRATAPDAYISLSVGAALNSVGVDVPKVLCSRFLADRPECAGDNCVLLSVDCAHPRDLNFYDANFFRQIDALVSSVLPNVQARLIFAARVKDFVCTPVNTWFDEDVVGQKFFSNRDQSVYAQWALARGVVSRPLVLDARFGVKVYCVVVDLDELIRLICRGLWEVDWVYQLVRHQYDSCILNFMFGMDNSIMPPMPAVAAGRVLPIGMFSKLPSQWASLTYQFKLRFSDLWVAAARRYQPGRSPTMGDLVGGGNNRGDVFIKCSRDFKTAWYLLAHFGDEHQHSENADASTSSGDEEWVNDLTMQGIEPNPGPTLYCLHAAFYLCANFINFIYASYDVIQELPDLSVRAAPVRDLTRYGVEPNPGPDTPFVDVNEPVELLTAQVEKAVRRYGSTDAGADWMMAALDPCHDSEFRNLNGMPTGMGSHSVVQRVNSDVTLTAPSALTSGTWEAKIEMWNCMQTLTINPGCFRSTNVIGPSVPATTMQVYLGANTTTTIGALNVISGPTNFDRWTSLSVSGLSAQNLSPGTTYTTGSYRVIAQAFEVRNVSSLLTRTGSVYLWRLPTPDVVETQPGQFVSTTTSNALAVSSTAYVWGAIPRNIAAATKIPSSRVLKASEGCYMVSRFNTVNPPISDNAMVVPVVDQLATTATITTDSNGTPLKTCAAPLPVPVSLNLYPVSTVMPAVNVTSFDLCGAIFSGMALTDVLELRGVWIIERFPTTDDLNLIVMVRSSPMYDLEALTLYSKMVGSLPVGVPARDNGLGEWFRSAVSAISSVAGPILSKVPHPAAQGAARIANAVSAATKVAKKAGKEVKLAESMVRAVKRTGADKKVTKKRSGGGNGRSKSMK